MAASVNRLLTLVGRFSRRRLMVVGDLMLDRFICGEVDRISPEAPVPVLRVTSESFRMGGAANVAHNIRTLGGSVSVAGIVGPDRMGRLLLRQLRDIGVPTTGVFLESGFQTIQKTRVIAYPRNQQIVRLDRENHAEARRPARERIRRFVGRRLARCDGVVISDYGKGVIHKELLEMVAGLAREKNLLCVVDPKKENFKAYRGASLVTPNLEEAAEASGIEIKDDASLLAAGRRLLELWQTKAVLITRGSRGMSLFRPGREARHFPTEPREIFDVTGAGDTVVAAIALALASGSTHEEAATIGNLAGGLVGREVGPVAVTLRDLKLAVRGKNETGR